MADMTSPRASVTIPARQRYREPSPGPAPSSPPAPRVEARPRHGAAPAARPPGPPPGRAPGADGLPVEVAERYLAPALKAAAAARARTAQIRAAAWAAAAGPAWPYPRQSVVGPPDQREAPAPAAPPLAGSPLLPDLRLAEMAAAWARCGLTVSDPPGLPAPPPAEPPARRGLSVAEAASASRIAFRPVRQPPPAGLAPPAGAPRPAAEPPAPATRAAAAPEPRAIPTVSGAPAGAGAPLPPPAPAKAVTRPGIARLLPGEAVRCAVPERAARQQRFAKTIAELQRYQAATRPSEPWGNVVPRPAVPQSSPATSDSRWSRLWSRR